jgi:ribonuclease HI
MKPQHLQLYSDGGARGNPGPAGIGGILKDARNGTILSSYSVYLGIRTNNQAEYEAVLEGVRRAAAMGATTLSCFLDSKLVVEQLQRRYRVKDSDLASLFVKVWNLMQKIHTVTFTHIPREANTAADALVNKAIDSAHSTRRR